MTDQALHASRWIAGSAAAISAMVHVALGQTSGPVEQNRFVSAYANVTGNDKYVEFNAAADFGPFLSAADAESSSHLGSTMAHADQESTIDGLVMSGTGYAEAYAFGPFDYGWGHSTGITRFDVTFHVDSPTILRLTGILTTYSSGWEAGPLANVSINGPGVSYSDYAPSVDGELVTHPFTVINHFVQGDYTIIVIADSAASTYGKVFDPIFAVTTFEFDLEPPGPGDVNGDAAVDISDLLIVIANWGACPPPTNPCPGDSNGNGVVDAEDLLEVIANWS